MFLAPRKQKISDIMINSIWAFIAWIIWSIILIVITFMISDFLDIVSTFEANDLWIKTSPMFPIIISLLTLLWTTIASFLSYYIITLTDPEKYKRSLVIFWQLAFLQFITYLFISPIYVYMWLMDYDNIMIIYIFHVLIIIFWTSLILEIFNNYRYILIWFYGSFIWLFVSILFTLFIFNSFWSWYAKLIMLTLLLPIINFTTIFLKQIFELSYYSYYSYTSLDPLWDIFYQIELEENDKAKIEEEKNTI